MRRALRQPGRRNEHRQAQRRLCEATISGGNGEGVPPVPIPNTEVKPFSADGTWLDTARESRSPPDSNRSNPDRIASFYVLDEEGDKTVSKIMAHAVKDLSDCDIAIGTTAGVGHGGISIITDEYEITSTTDVYADLSENNSEMLFKRSEDGIKKALEIVLLLLNNKIQRIESLENTEIKKI